MDATRLPLLITGGSGFIGSRLALFAASAGFPVTALAPVRNPIEEFRTRELSRAGIPIVEATLADEEHVRGALRGQHTVIHLAAAQHEVGLPESYFHEVNVEGTRRLLMLALDAGVRRFVYGSSIGVYGEASDAELDETSPLAPANPYGRSKAAAERVVHTLSERIETVIARISETYGPGDLRLLKLFRAIESGRYVTIGTGRNEHQPIFVEDLCRALLAAATLPQAVGQTLVLAGEERVTTDDMVCAISHAVGRKAPGLHVPLWPFSALAGVFELASKPLGLKPPLHQRRLDFFRRNFRFSTARAAQVLNLRARVRFEEGARRTLEWYREAGFMRAAPSPPRAPTPTELAHELDTKTTRR
ncbi:MAG: NAD-dependent epimerase/dehydratase family protein [Steroidobacteraceae bacterium]|nr:NAD-dependent epimerase/dehydratase family protein [Steroidobacteraceae bacterium]